MRTILFVSLLLISHAGKAQLKLSSAGAMAALNVSNVTTTPSSAPLNYLTATPIPAGPPSTTPVSVLGQVSSQSIVPNDRTLTVAYQSALAWASGYLNYEQAAQGLHFSGATPIDIALAISAANYILADGVFTPFQYYSPRRSTMIMRANDQAPVHFPKISLINHASVQLNMYTPSVSSYSVEVPLKF